MKKTLEQILKTKYKTSELDIDFKAGWETAVDLGMAGEKLMQLIDDSVMKDNLSKYVNYFTKATTAIEESENIRMHLADCVYAKWPELAENKLSFKVSKDLKYIMPYETPDEEIAKKVEGDCVKEGFKTLEESNVISKIANGDEKAKENLIKTLTDSAVRDCPFKGNPSAEVIKIFATEYVDKLVKEYFEKQENVGRA